MGAQGSGGQGRSPAGKDADESMGAAEPASCPLPLSQAPRGDPWLPHGQVGVGLPALPKAGQEIGERIAVTLGKKGWAGS